MSEPIILTAGPRLNDNTGFLVAVDREGVSIPGTVAEFDHTAEGYMDLSCAGARLRVMDLVARTMGISPSDANVEVLMEKLGYSIAEVKVSGLTEVWR
jgi:hypothetical protein